MQTIVRKPKKSKGREGPLFILCHISNLLSLTFSFTHSVIWVDQCQSRGNRVRVSESGSRELNDCWLEQREWGRLGRGNGDWTLDIGHTDIRTELTSWRWQRGTDEHRIVTTATNDAQAIFLPFYRRQTTGECDSVLSLRFSFSFPLLCPCVVWTNGCITSQVRYDWTDINCVVIFFPNSNKNELVTQQSSLSLQWD